MHTRIPNNAYEENETNFDHPSTMTAMVENNTGAYENPQFGCAFSQLQVDEVNDQYANSRSSRIRAAMFPESIDADQSNCSSINFDHYGRSTNVQRLTEPSQILKTAVAEVINFQDDVELTTKAIPELIKLLSDKDEAVVGRAAQLVHLLTRQPTSIRAVVQNAALVGALVKAADKCSNEDTTRDTAAALYHISQHGQGLMHIFRSGGIPQLVRMLSCPSDQVVNYAITTLHNLILYQENAKSETRSCGGIGKMTILLDRTDGKLLAIVADCLYLLMLQHTESKLVFLSCVGPPKLVRILETSDYDKLLYATVRTVKALSVCPENKSSLVDAGGVQALQRHLDRSHLEPSRLSRAVLWTLRNLSDVATKESNVGDLLLRLIALLDNDDQQVVVCCAGILSNLSCNNTRNKQTLCTNGAIPSLVRLLDRWEQTEDATEPALCALRHVTTRHALAEQAQTDVRVHGGIGPLLRLLAKMRAPVAKAALGLVRNLAQSPANLLSLRDERLLMDNGTTRTVVTMAVEVLTRAYTQIRETQLQGKDMVPITDGVSMNELLECALGALHHLGREPICCRQITDCRANIVPILVQLLTCELEDVQRECAGLLYEISKCPDGARLVDSEGVTPILTDLMRSRNKAISTYSSGVLKNLQLDKPAEYRQQLDMEIQSALYRDDSTFWTHDGLDEIAGGDEPCDYASNYDMAADDRWMNRSGTNTIVNRIRGDSRSGWHDTDL